MTKSTYNEKSIKQLSGFEHIRHRPSAYLVDSHISGCFGVLKELIDNSVDELAIGKQNGQLTVILFLNAERTNYQIAVIDNGRGIPVGALNDVFINTLTSGKFDTKSYATSAGSFGVGASVTTALSNWFRAISLNHDVIGDTTIRYDNIPDDITTIDNPFGYTGTIVMHEPDATIFTGIPAFANDHSKLSDYLIQLSLFSKYGIKLICMNRDLPKKIRTASTLQVIEYLTNIVTNVQPMFDSTDENFRRDDYIKNYFGITRKWDSVIPIEGKSPNGSISIQGDLCVSTGSNPTGNTRLAMVNDILFSDNASLHTALLYKHIKNKMVDLITDKSIRVFFVDHYKLPIWLVIDVRFVGAVYSGLAKVSFRDLKFKYPYQVLLNTVIKPEMINDIFQLISSHIEIAYNKFSNKDFAISGSMKNIMSRLNRPDKFDDCGTNDRSIAELFLVEGDSANGDEGRDSNFQASYTLGGKPFNGLTTPDKLGDSVNAIKRNAVFQDIIRILNITPGNDDLSNLNFYKIFIMADADTHGYHITDIVISNLFAVCPALITNGHVYVIKPPLYSLNIKGNAPIYIQDSEVLNTTLAYQVYYRCIDITIQSDTYTHTLNREEFAAFSELVVKIGDELERLSVEYMIPAFLLEMLSLMTSHLNLRQPNVQLIQEYLGCEVRYVSAGHLLVVSIGSDDIVVPLNQITELLYTRILPLYREFYYGRTRLFVTTKNSDAMKNQPTSIIQIYEIFKRLSGMFTIKRYKGLGSMPPKDRAINCLNPATRNAFQITSIGDIKTIFNMMGSDPTERKRLVLA